MRYFACILTCVLCLGHFVHAQDVLPLEESDLKFIEKEQKGFKRGLSIMPFPIASYNSDLGFQFGAYADLYDYGYEPSIYPKYFHHFHIEASHYTKGQNFVHGEYESSFLIPGVRFITSLTWQDDPLYQFYGWNGAVNTYDPLLDRNNGIAFYSYKRQLLRFLSSFQGSIGGKWSWMAALNFRYIKSGDLDFDAFDSDNTLFRQYTDKQMIRPDELKGLLGEILCGVKYDSRDFEPDPSHGIWSEVYLNGSPDFFGTGYPYLKAAVHWRHYITPGPTWLTFAYHLAYQTTLLGNPPFYVEQDISTIQIRQACAEGLGGINTLRGIVSNRLVGDAYAWGNFELRFRILQFQLAGFDFALALNPFLDAGMITRPFRLEDPDMRALACKPHATAGIGGKIAMNTNLVLSAEWGKPFDKNDGRSGLYFGLNYIF